MSKVKRGRFQLESSYLGLAASLATLLVYEPALHSFAPFGRFDEVVTLFVLCSLLAFVIAAIALVACRCRERSRWLRNGLAVFGSAAFLAVLFLPLPSAATVVAGFVAGTGSALVMEAWGALSRLLHSEGAAAHCGVLHLGGAAHEPDRHGAPSGVWCALRDSRPGGVGHGFVGCGRRGK